MHIRNVREEDKEYIFSWLKNIWSGRDYIPHIWERWIREGEFLAICNNRDKPIAIWHIRWLPNGIAWFEGMRVKPEYQGKGLAKIANKHSIELAKKKGYKLAMLITMIDNIPAQKSLEKFGFKRVAAYTMTKIKNEVTEHDDYSVETLTWQKFKEIAVGIEINNYIMASKDSPWIFLPIDESRFNEIPPKKRISVNNNAVAIIGNTIKIGKEKYTYVRYLDARNDSSLHNIITIISKNKTEHTDGIFIYLPNYDQLIRIASGILKIDIKETFLVYSIII